MDTMEMKKKLRLQMAAVRAGIDESVRHARSEAACHQAEAKVLGPMRKALSCKEGKGLTIFTYLSYRDEPSTAALIEWCLEHGDTVLVPRVSASGQMTLHRFDGPNSIAPGAWGIPEPKESVPVWPKSRYGEIDLVIVPGLAFDLQGGRIGYGGGYYDRFAEQLCGVAEEGGIPLYGSLLFEEQLVEQVPAEEHDLKLDLLFLATDVIYIK
ncbi:5-formyltetrahydrofolate cyclo-ligase [Paenibacillus caui]|uniref:5-formyltetrahydrofolate cyclo-ligase n=1 Tax=Paenibacillus caui TaxID=2873927 RepID=UPI001CA8A337|nr:5-formyltetrahydrofolate cyclo-ligase [Paenibacillus caui]